MMIHRIGNTLLIDDFDVQRFLMQQEDCNWQWLRSFIYNHIFTRLNDPDRTALNKQALNDSTQQRSLLSKFLYHSLSRTDEVQLQAESDSESCEQLDLDLLQPQFRLPPIDGPLLPEPNIEENVPDPKHQHTYNRNVVWTFEDIRMLIGTDMAIFGGASRPCISLRLRDMQQPINVLTGIDYWLVIRITKFHIYDPKQHDLKRLCTEKVIWFPFDVSRMALDSKHLKGEFSCILF